MRIVSKPIEVPVEEDLLSKIAPLPDFLFVDIETTGLSAEHCNVYLIGCAYRQADGWNLIQWLDSTGLEEKEVLSSFLIFASSYKYLVHFNGDRFDLPFLRRRFAENGLTDSTEALSSLDLYKTILPYKSLLGLPDYKQQTLEALLGTGREEAASGGDLIKLYKKFIANQVPELLARLLDHNEADVLGLLSLVPLLAYQGLAQTALKVYRAQANNYTDYDGSRKEELFLFFRLEEPLPAPVYASADHCYVKIEKNAGILKIPLYTEILKYFYANYKDYYFLPEEDMAVHKYLAGFVEKDHRIQAKPETCYTRKAGSFLPQWDLFQTPFFKRTYGDKELFFEFTADCKKSREFLSGYATYVFRHILGK